MTRYGPFQAFPTRNELSQALAARVTHLAGQAVRAGRHFTIALSGGSLLDLLSPPLVAQPLGSNIDWTIWEVFWADERCVSLQSSESNFAAAKKLFLDQVSIPKKQIHTLDDSLEPAAAARAYEAELRKVLQPEPGRLPRLDLILLGMGEDGHTASLFPGHEVLQENTKWVAPVFDAPKPPPERITLTLPVINNAREVIFVVAGQGKAAAVQNIFEAEDGRQGLPAALVKPGSGRLTWFVDSAAVQKLTSRSILPPR